MTWTFLELGDSGREICREDVLLLIHGMRDRWLHVCRVRAHMEDLALRAAIKSVGNAIDRACRVGQLRRDLCVWIEIPVELDLDIFQGHFC